MESIRNSVPDYYEDDVETSLFNEVCELYVKLIEGLDIKSESHISPGVESLTEEEFGYISGETLVTGNKVEDLNEDDPNYFYDLEKGCLGYGNEDNKESEHIFYDENLEESVSKEVSTESSPTHSEEAMSVMASIYPDYSEMIETIMLKHYNVYIIGRVQYTWLVDTPRYVMMEADTEWEVIYVRPGDDGLFFSHCPPMRGIYSERIHPDRRKIMLPRKIVTRRAGTLNTFLTALTKDNDLIRFQVLAGMNKALNEGYQDVFKKLEGLIDNLEKCIFRIDFTGLQSMAVRVLTHILCLPHIMREKK